MAPASGNVSRPGRALAVLVALIVLLFLAIVGSNAFQPASWRKDLQVHLGLDLTSGTTVALKAETAKGRPPSAAEMQEALNIMESRVNGAGFTGAQVQQQGSDVITVAVPGKGSQQVVNLVGQTANLLFRQVLLVAPNSSAAATPTPSASASASATRSPSASASASTSASASPSPSPSATSGVSTVSQASGDASLVSAPVKAQFNKLNCADKNWKQQVGYTGSRRRTTTRTSRSSRATRAGTSTRLTRPRCSARWCPREAPAPP